MARVERGNVVLHVDDRDVDYYINMGYNHTDEQGGIISAALPKDVGVLQKYYVEHLAKIESLEKEIANLTAGNTAAKAAKSSPKKSTKVDE